MAVGTSGKGPFVTDVTVGRTVDLGTKDAVNTGIAMVLAVTQTISDLLQDIGTTPEDYDLIPTDDLGLIGTKLVCQALADNSLDITDVYNDYGTVLYDREKRDVHAGNSGCGYSASVPRLVILNRLQSRELNNALFITTGVLTSTTFQQQRESAPDVVHLMRLTST